MNFFVYFLRSTTGPHFYVGSTGHLESRIARHFDELKRGCHHNTSLQRLWDDGVRFSVETLKCRDEVDARISEQRIISDNLANPSLINISMGVNGGDNMTRHPRRDELAEAAKQRLLLFREGMTEEQKLDWSNSRKGEANGMFGRTHTSEARRKMSEVNLAENREPRRGFHLSDETKDKLREKGKMRTGSRNGFYGKNHSDESKQAMSERHRALRKDPSYISATSKSVKVNGKEFVSAKQASRELEIPYTLLIHRIKSPLNRYSDYQYVDKCPTTIESASKEESE
mgnify:CR=1 FL=1|jgi:group I intron endonuclease